jgi:hypothetical protein
LAADGPVWEVALERWGEARDEEAVRILWQRCCNRAPARAARSAGRARAARPPRAPLDTRRGGRNALRGLGAALGALDRVRFLSPGCGAT